MAKAEEQVVLAAPSGRLFGMVHLPAAARPRLGFVVCHPFAEEKKCSHRALAMLARALTDAGHAVLRFDFSGCGDSEGDLGDATLDAWRADLAAAQAFLHERAPEAEPALLGLRLGAAVAALAADNDPPPAALVLWAPVIDGRAYFAADLRRVLIKQMMTAGRTQTTRQELMAQLDAGEGAIDFDGFRLTGALYRGLCSIDLAPLRPAAKRIFLLDIGVRPELRPEYARLAETWRAAGLPVDAAAVVAPPLWNRLDLVDAGPAIGATLDWLQRGLD